MSEADHEAEKAKRRAKLEEILNLQRALEGARAHAAHTSRTPTFPPRDMVTTRRDSRRDPRRERRCDRHHGLRPSRSRGVQSKLF